MEIEIKGKLPSPISSHREEQVQQIVEAILKSREIEDLDRFIHATEINPDYLKELQRLFDLELGKAQKIIDQAIKNNQSIVIHGDYDVDGVCATAILWEAFYYGLDYSRIIPFIPHRIDHGYGVSRESIDRILIELAEKGLAPGVLITVDCGITAKNALEYAKEKGFELIVTDHHTLPEDKNDLPSVGAVLHTYELSGAGIAWVLACSLVPDDLEQGVDLSALATIADIQPVTGYNRNLVKQGLAHLSKSKRTGLQALYQVAGIQGKPIGTYEVGWVIGPRLNATGRLEHAMNALRLLVVRNSQQALELANQLHMLNRERQQMTQNAVDQAVQIVEAQWDQQSPIIVAHEDWHEGIIGLIAGKLVEKYKAPAIAISVNGQTAKGSARSIKGINIVDLLRQFEDLFDGMGGHAEAAGFQLGKENLTPLHEKIHGISLTDSLSQIQGPRYTVDLALEFGWLSWELYEMLEKLEPFGVGNPRPMFLTRGMTVLDFRLVGNDKSHLALTFPDNLRGIAFGLGEKAKEINPGDEVDLIYSLEADDYRGGKNLQLKVKHILMPQEEY